MELEEGYGGEREGGPLCFSGRDESPMYCVFWSCKGLLRKNKESRSEERSQRKESEGINLYPPQAPRQRLPYCFHARTLGRKLLQPRPPEEGYGVEREGGPLCSNAREESPMYCVFWSCKGLLRKNKESRSGERSQRKESEGINLYPP